MGVCGPTECWNELRNVKAVWNLPWCIAGDFNAVRFPHERSGAHRLTTVMEDFSAFIRECELIDLPMSGADFTWSGGG